MKFTKTENLSDYFAALDERLDEILPDRTSVLAHIAGYTVRLVFPNVDYARYVIPDMFVQPDNGISVDATFTWWEDSIEPYQLHDFAHLKKFEQYHQDFFKVSDDYGYIEIIWDELRAEDCLKNNYYLLSNPATNPKWVIANHPFAQAVFLWAQRHNFLMVHAAAVGIDGHGVLIVGHGGTGKSTLASSCLAGAFEFVSDDYCLLSATGSRTVYPIYTNVSLNPDSLDRLPMFKPFEILPMQEEKEVFTVSETMIKPALPVEAIILPWITEKSEPELTVDKSGKALAQVIYSTNKQLGCLLDTVFIRKLSKRLLGMPVYRFSLTKDLHKNCHYLKKWIREVLPCTN